jgi:hypothetical protein
MWSTGLCLVEGLVDLEGRWRWSEVGNGILEVRPRLHKFKATPAPLLRLASLHNFMRGCDPSFPTRVDSRLEKSTLKVNRSPSLDPEVAAALSFHASQFMTPWLLCECHDAHDGEVLEGLAPGCAE